MENLLTQSIIRTTVSDIIVVLGGSHVNIFDRIVNVCTFDWHLHKHLGYTSTMMPEPFLLLLHLHTTTFGIYDNDDDGNFVSEKYIWIYELRFSSFFRGVGSCVVYVNRKMLAYFLTVFKYVCSFQKMLDRWRHSEIHLHTGCMHFHQHHHQVKYLKWN